MELSPNRSFLTRASLLVSLMTLGVGTACSDEGGPRHEHGDGGASGSGDSGAGGAAPEGGGTAFALKFKAVVGSEPFGCESMFMGLGTADRTLLPNDFRFYVHDVRLIGAGGAETPLALTSDGKWQTAEVALVDFENNAGTCANGTTDTNDTVTGTAPEGTYTGVVFKIGVPEALNHQNPAEAPSPLNLTAMEWDWTYGYKFMKIDFAVHMPTPEAGMPMGDAGSPEGGGGHGQAGRATFFHIGSGLCTGNPREGGAVQCERANRPEIELHDLDLATEAVIVDYAALIAGIDPAMDRGGAPGCMSGGNDPECTPMFEAVGVDLATGATKAGQTAFTVGPQ